jgi:hypothetical protein
MTIRPLDKLGSRQSNRVGNQRGAYDTVIFGEQHACQKIEMPSRYLA